MDDKALIKFSKDFEPIPNEKWNLYGDLHLQLVRWSNELHSLPKFLEVMGARFLSSNLPLSF